MVLAIGGQMRPGGARTRELPVAAVAFHEERSDRIFEQLCD